MPDDIIDGTEQPYDTQPFSLLRPGRAWLRSRIAAHRPIPEDREGPGAELASIRAPGVPLLARPSARVAGPLPGPHDPHLHEASHDQRWLLDTAGRIYEGQHADLRPGTRQP